MSSFLIKIRNIVGFFVLLFLVSVSVSANAATYTWDGGGADENWTTCGNWSSDICPLATDSVIFSASSTKDVDIDANIAVANFSINSGYSGTIAPVASQTIIITGNFTQATGTFTASAATTTVGSSFTFAGGTFNHNGGVMEFTSYASSTITPGSAVFNNVYMQRAGTGGGFTMSIGSDMTIEGNFVAQNATSGNSFDIRSSITNATRTITVAGNFLLPTGSGGGQLNFGGLSNAFVLHVVVGGNFEMYDTNAILYADLTFASSSTQTVTRTLGTINSTSDWYDTGSGDLMLTGNFTGSQTLQPDGATDFNFVNSGAFTFTTSANVATGTTWSPYGPSSYILNSPFNINGGTFNAATSTFIGSVVINGTFNAVSNGTTTFGGSITFNSGTFNHNNGTAYLNPTNSGTYTYTTAGMTFNNVYVDRPGINSSSANLAIATDMVVDGTMRIRNSNTNSGSICFIPSPVTTVRTLTINGDLIMPSGGVATLYFGSDCGSTSNYNLRTVLNGNFLMTGSNSIQVYSDFIFASSSNQTISKTGSVTIQSFSDWYDTGAGHLVLTENYSGSQVLRPDSLDDFNFVSSSAFSMTSGASNIATGTTWSPSGAGVFYTGTMNLTAGTFSPINSTTYIGNLTINGGTFNAVSSGTTTLIGAFTYVSGTFNHNNGTVHANMPSGGTYIYTSGSALFNNLYVERTGSSSSHGYFALGDNLTVNGNLTIRDTNTNSASVCFVASPAVNRVVTIGGDLLFPSGGTSNVFYGNDCNSTSNRNIATVLSGNLNISAAGSGSFDSDLTFAGSGTQTLTKSGSMSIGKDSDWYDTGSGNLQLLSAFSGTQWMHTDSVDDFNLVNSGVFTLTASSTEITGGTTWTPSNSGIIATGIMNLTSGTFNPATTTQIGSITINGGTFNAVSNGSTTLIGSFTYTSGTFNHNNGTVSLLVPSSGTYVLTPNSAVFNNFYLDRPNTTSGQAFVALATDMTIDGSATFVNNNTNSGSLCFYQSPIGTTRTITIGGNLTFPVTVAQFLYGFDCSTVSYNLRTVLAGNLTISASSNMTFYSDLVFSSTSPQIINKTGAASISSASEWLINNPTTVSLAANMITSGNFNIATGTLRTAGFNITATAGILTGAAGNLEIIGYETVATSTFSAGGTMTYTGATSTTYALKPWTYGNLTIQSTGTTYTLGATTTVAGNLRIASGTLDVTATNRGLSVAGNWYNAGTYNARTGTTTFNGTNQTITGTTTFYHFIKSVAAADTLTFGAGETQTISGTWTANGASGNLLSLRSTNTPSQWKINPQGTRTLSYIDVKDSNNTNAAPIGGVVGIVNSGNNLNWGFDDIPPGATGITVTPATTTASIVWVTDESATSTFKYGLTSAYGNASTSNGTSSHEVTLTGLISNALYHYAVVSTDPSGNTATTTDATFMTLDGIAPIISSIASTTAHATATISWLTDEAASSTVSYGLTTSYGSTSVSIGTSTHTINISNLTPSTLYHFQITATDASGNIATSSDLTFTTSATPDVTSPTAQNIVVTPAANTASVTWDTTEAATSTFQYSTDMSFASSSVSLGTTSHDVSLSNLISTTLYNYRIVSRDLAGNYSTTTPSTFTTLDNVPPVISSIGGTGDDTSRTITWSTNEAASSTVDFGLTTSYGTASTSNGTTSHFIILTGLTASTTYHYRITATDMTANVATTTDLTFTTTATPDTTPATLSNGSPTTSLAAGTTNTTLSVDTNEPATCKYGTVGGTAYASIASTFTTTGSLNHSADITGLADGNSYTYYVRCEDANANQNTSDYAISFSVAAPVVIPPTPDPVNPPKIEGAWNQPTITGGTAQAIPPQLQPIPPVVPVIPPGLIKFIFKKDLSQGMNNNDVRELQKFLNKNGFVIAKVGAGSPGKETTLFGPATRAAVLKFQIAKNIKGANGRFGPATRAVVNGVK